MTIAAASVNDAATSVAPTGGTSESFTSIGDSLNQHDVVYGTGSVLDRKSVTFKTVHASVQGGAPNGYSQQRSTFKLKHPLVLANEERTVNTVKVELACDIETTDAQKLNLRLTAAQLLADTALTEFYNSQSAA